MYKLINKSRFLSTIILLSIFVIFTDSNIKQSEGVSKEYQIKSAIIIKICNYSKIKPSSDYFILGILGELPGGSTFKVPKGVTINGLPVRIQQIENANELKSLNALFVTKSASADYYDIIDESIKNGVITFTEKRGLGKQGAMINFFNSSDNTIKFEVNIKSIKAAEISLSAAIYQIAERLYR